MARFSSRRKFSAQWSVDREGGKHPSKAEARWFDRLLDRRDRGEIRDLEREPCFSIDLVNKAGDLVHVCKVRADARYFDVELGRVVVVDFKGIEGNTRDSQLRRKLVAVCHGVEIELAGPARVAADRKIERKAWEKLSRQRAKADGENSKRRASIAARRSPESTA